MRKKSAPKVLTKHPTKTGRRIDKGIYDQMKKVMISVLRKKPLTHNELFAALERKLKGKVDWNVFWYGETVKLDLEARKIIKRTDDKPQKYFVVWA